MILLLFSFLFILFVLFVLLSTGNTAATMKKSSTNGNNEVYVSGGFHWSNQGSLRMLNTPTFNPPATTTALFTNKAGGSYTADVTKPTTYSGMIDGCGTICYASGLPFHACVVDSSSMARFQGVTCTACVSGKRGSSDGDGCTSCTPGLYQPETQKAFCLTCAAGEIDHVLSTYLPTYLPIYLSSGCVFFLSTYLPIYLSIVFLSNVYSPFFMPHSVHVLQ